MQELQKLNIESQKQNRYVNQLKNKLEDGKINNSIRLVKEVSPPVQFDPSAEKYNTRKSKGKVCLLFNSNQFRDNSKSKPTLKKSKSEQYF